MCEIHNQLDTRCFRVDMFGLNCCGSVAFILYIYSRFDFIWFMFIRLDQV